MGECVEKLPHSCGSSDGLQVFLHDDGEVQGWCFVCGTYEDDPYNGKPVPEFTPKSPEEKQAELDAIAAYPCKSIPDRKLKDWALKRFGVRTEVSQQDGKTPTLACFPYGHADVNGVVAWKMRVLSEKRMWSVGRMKDCLPFGWRQALRSGAKTLYITEGEFDAVALYQILKEANIGTAYADVEHAVISVPSGAKSAAKVISKLRPEIDKHFKETVLVFDQDEAGQKAAEEVCRIAPNFMSATLPCKDPNECLIDGASKAAHSAVVFRAEKPKNSRIVYGSSLRDAARQEAVMGLSWPWQGLTEATRGIRRGETIYIGAGVKMG